MPHFTATVFLPDELIATMRTRITRTPKGMAVRAIANEFHKAVTLQRRCDVRAIVASAVSSQTITCSSASAVNDTDTLTIGGGTALAVKATPTTQDQVSKGTTDAAFAANVVAKINANTNTSKIVWAAVTSSATGVITIYSVYPGPIGDLITLAEVGNGFTLTGAALTGGASDAVKHHIMGYDRAAHVAG